MERNRGIAQWRSRGKLEGRMAAVGRPTSAAKEGRCARGRGRGRGTGGGGEDHLCGASLGLQLPLSREVTHLQTCRRGGVAEIQYRQCNTHHCAGRQLGTCRGSGEG